MNCKFEIGLKCDIR